MDKNNEGKNEGPVGKGGVPTPEGKRFSSDYQPPAENKSAGWDRKQFAEDIMNKVRYYLGLPASQLKAIIIEIQEGSEQYTALDMKAISYILKDKYTVDLINRGVPYAPKEVDVKSGGKPIKGFLVEYVDKIDTPEDGNGESEGDERPEETSPSS